MTHYSLALYRLNLGQSAPLAEGKQKWVFEYPGKPELLIKVVNPEYKASYYTRPWPFRGQRERFYHVYVRELKEQLAMRVFDTPSLDYVAPIVGLVDTDLGVGQVMPAIKDDKGQLAPTLYQLIQQRQFTPEIEHALDTLLDWYEQTEIIISDLRPRNMVLASDKRLVIVDGIGNKNLIPFRHIRWVNRLKNRRKSAEVRKNIKAFARRVAAKGT